MSLSAAERETSILCDDETNKWEVFTCQTKIINKLNKLGIEPRHIDAYGGHYYSLNYNQLSFRSGKKRKMSEEQRNAASKRLQKARESK